jgi:Phage integrase, N-terminal SAM-like domain
MSTDSISPLRQRMIEDMNARKLCAGTQKGHIRSCRRFAAFLKRSPDTATAEDIRRFQLHLAETAMSICNRNRIMTGLRFMFRVTLRRLDLAAAIARSAKAPQQRSGSPSVRRNYCLSATSMSSSRCRRPSPISLTTTRRSSRRTIGALPTAISCLGAFRSPAASAPGGRLVRSSPKADVNLKDLIPTLCAKDRDRGAPHGAAPPTPPGIRVRTTAVREVALTRIDQGWKAE